MGVLRKFSRVEEDDVESLVGCLREHIEIPKVGRFASSKSKHLEAIQITLDGKVLNSYCSVVIVGRKV